MLVPCPDCQRPVSDRARACPNCGCPVVEVLAEHATSSALDTPQLLSEDPSAIASRVVVGEVDCPKCDARGFRSETFEDAAGQSHETYAWCRDCQHTGRVVLIASATGYYAAALHLSEGFLRGAVAVSDEGITDLGPTPPKSHRFPAGGRPYHPNRP